MPIHIFVSILCCANLVGCAGISPNTSPFATPGVNVIESPAQFHVGETALTVENYVKETFLLGFGILALPFAVVEKLNGRNDGPGLFQDDPLQVGQ